jgi:hypothetical protein
MAQAGWLFQLGEPAPSLVRTRMLTKAKGRRCTWRADGISDAQVSFEGFGAEARLPKELETDLYVLYDGEELYRGRIGTGYDEHNGDAYTVNFSAMDYRGRLRWAVVQPPGMVFVNVSQADIAMDLIDAWQTLPGAGMGITRGVGGASGIGRTIAFKPGADLNTAISDLGRTDAGFEWDIDPALKFNQWYPRRGVVTTSVLSSSNIVEFRRTFSPDSFGSSVVTTGSSLTTPISKDGLVNTPKGRWDIYQSFGEVDDQGLLEARTRRLLREVQSTRPELTIKLKRNTWRGPTHFWLGDSLRVVIKKGRLNINEMYRVVEFALSLGESGEADIRLGLIAHEPFGVYGKSKYGEAVYA